MLDSEFSKPFFLVDMTKVFGVFDREDRARELQLENPRMTLFDGTGRVVAGEENEVKRTHFEERRSATERTRVAKAAVIPIPRAKVTLSVEFDGGTVELRGKTAVSIYTKTAELKGVWQKNTIRVGHKSPLVWRAQKALRAAIAKRSKV